MPIFTSKHARVLKISLRSKTDYYKILGVSRDATNKEIKKAFRNKSLNCHPDKFPGNEKKEAEFKVLSEAYQNLSDKKLKKDYDDKNSPSSGMNRGYQPGAVVGDLGVLVLRAGEF